MGGEGVEVEESGIAVVSVERNSVTRVKITTNASIGGRAGIFGKASVRNCAFPLEEP